MNVTLRQPMTVEQFLAWEERQPLRYEFDGVGAMAMVGVRVAHAAIQSNLIAALSLALRGKPCRVYGSDLKIAVAGSIRYPDAFVVCAPLSARATVVNEPVVVFEILSEGTSHTDMIVKNAEYRATPSIKRYVLLEHTGPGALVFVRSGEDWLSEPLDGLEAMLRMPEIDAEISLGELYADMPDSSDIKAEQTD